MLNCVEFSVWTHRNQAQILNLQANEGRQDTLKELLWEMRASCIKDAQLTAEDIQKRINYIPWTDKMEKGWAIKRHSEKESANSHKLYCDHVQGGIILSTFAEEYCENEWNIISTAIRDVWRKATGRKIPSCYFWKGILKTG